MRYLGEIVLVSRLLNPQGRNPKDRPAVVMTTADLEGQGMPLLIIAVTTLIPHPLPDDHLLLLWQRPRHPRTGLTKRCAAVCSWLTWIDEERILQSIGFVPGKQLKALKEALERLG